MSSRGALTGEARLIEKGMKEIERERELLAKLCGRLIRFPTENPPAMATAIMEFIKEWLADFGLSSRTFCREKGKENLISNYGRKLEPGLVLYGHADVVPAGERRRWKFPPYCGKIIEGKILGRGAADMKGGLAAELLALKVIAQLDVELQKNLQLAVIPDEENFDVERRLLYKLIDDGVIAGQGCVMAEPSGLDAIEVGDKGDLWLRVRATGRPAHGSSPVFGDSAILRLIEAIRAMGTIWTDEPSVPSDVKEVLPFSTEVVKQTITNLGIPERFEEGKRLLTHTSVNVGTIRGGTMINMVADKAEADIALCLAPGVTAANAMIRIKELLSKVPAVEIDTLCVSDPNFTPPNHPIVSTLRDAYQSITGRDAKPYHMTGTSDAHGFRLRKIPTALFGPGDMSVIHGYDEYVDMKELTLFAKTYFKTAVEFCA